MRLFFFLFTLLATEAQAADRVIINPDVDGDLKFKVNKTSGGVTDALHVEGTTAEVELKVRDDDSCGTGTLCSGSFTCTASTTSNLDSTPTCLAGNFIKTGNVTTYSFGLTGVDVTTTGSGQTVSFRVTLPLTSSNFAAVGRATGSCVMDSVATVRPTVFWVEAVPGAQQALIATRFPEDGTSRPVWCNITFLN